MMRIRRIGSRQFMIFITGGLASAVIDVGIMQLMINFGFDHIISATIGFFFGFLFNYAFHANLTFKSVVCLSTVIRFVAVIGINYLITISFVTVAYSILGNALLGKIISLPFVAVNGFLLSKYWVFVTAQPLEKSKKFKHRIVMEKRPELTMPTEDDSLIIAMQGEIESLSLQIKQQAEEIEKLKGQLRKNSQNSSKIPSSDGLSKTAPKGHRKPSTKNTGGQKKHQGHQARHY